MPTSRQVFEKLTPGTTVILKKGYGSPFTKNDLRVVIKEVDCHQMLAKTNDGRTITCEDAQGIEFN